MLKKQYLELCKYFDEILASKKIELISCEDLHVIRYHPSIINKYKFFTKDKKFQDIYFFFTIKLYSIYLLYRLIINLFLPKNYLLETKKNKIHIKNVFFSHLINIKNFPNKFDHFYGNMPFISKNIFQNMIALFNHGNYKSHNIFKNKKNDLSYMIINFNYSFYKNLNVLKKILKEDKELQSQIKKENNQLKKQCLKFARLSLLKYSTFRNICFYNYIDNFFYKSNIKNVFFTFEGHAWEKLVICAAKRSSIKTIAYNQSGLLRMQHSLFNIIDSKFYPDTILTAGLNSYFIFKKFLKKEIKIENIGSFRSLEIENSQIYKTFNNNILVITEGIKDEAIILFNFIDKISDQFSNINFYFRLHPEFDLNKLKKYLKTKKINSNIIFTNNNFQELLKICFFVVHRGSTAVIQAVSNGLIPIYVLGKNEQIFSPIANVLYRKNIIRFSEFSLFKKKIDNFKNSSLSKKQFDFASNYYTKFDNKLFNKNFNI